MIRSPRHGNSSGLRAPGEDARGRRGRMRGTPRAPRPAGPRGRRRGSGVPRADRYSRRIVRRTSSATSPPDAGKDRRTAGLGGRQLDHALRGVHGDDPPPRPAEDQQRAGQDRAVHRKRAQRVAVRDQPVVLRGPERGVEAVVVDQPVALAARAAAGRRPAAGAGRGGPGRAAGRRRSPGRRGRTARLRRAMSKSWPAVAPPCWAVIDRICWMSVDRCRPVVSGGSYQDAVSSSTIATVWNSSARSASVGLSPGGEFAFRDVDPQDGGAAGPAAGPAEALAQAGDGRRGADLGDRVHRADVDAQLQGGGADRGHRRWPGP